MRHHGAFVSALAATILAWILWLATAFTTDPNAARTVGFALFYTTFWCAVAGSATFIGIAVRRHTVPREDGARIAIRQGVLVGVAVTLAVFLQSRGILSWVNITFLITALTLIEWFWISRTLGMRKESATGGSRASG